MNTLELQCKPTYALEQRHQNPDVQKEFPQVLCFRPSDLQGSKCYCTNWTLTTGILCEHRL